MRVGMMLAAFGLAVSPIVAQESALSAKYTQRIERILTENIAPFWLAKSLDRVNGGYIINFGPASEPGGAAPKALVTQARMVWYFARMARAGRDVQQNLAAAEIGYRFLREKLWDEKNGGFYWEVDPTGDKKLMPRKHLYGQSYALYAVSEYYLASRRQDVLAFATQIFEVLEARAHDRTYGGYIEYFNQDWTSPPPGEISYMGVTADWKLMNTHLHLMEAMTTFYRARKLPQARERLLELIEINSNAVVRKDVGACTDKYRRDWTPILDAGFGVVSYGHDIENVWLLIDACEAAVIPVRPFLDLFRTLWRYSLKHGYDGSAGGFYESGPINRNADALRKIWWVEAEAIVSALYMFRMTGDSQYLEVFDKTLNFIEKHLVDWRNGEWHEYVTPDGKTGGSKAHAWKAAYHDGRAMIECLQLLK